MANGWRKENVSYFTRTNNLNLVCAVCYCFNFSIRDKNNCRRNELVVLLGLTGEYDILVDTNSTHFITIIQTGFLI